MNNALIIKDKLDDLYIQVLNGRQDIFDDSDRIMIDILKLEDLSSFELSEAEQIKLLIQSFIEKINLIYEILEVKKDNLLTIEHLKSEFSVLEMQRFNIENNYVMGILKIEEINQFKNNLFQYRNKLYAIPISDSNLLDVAKLKSKVQHFNTEILEDEDLLSQAYQNSN